jgi:hypothetical protein
MASTHVTVFPVPGLEKMYVDFSLKERGEDVRSENYERSRPRRSQKDCTDSLKLLFILRYQRIEHLERSIRRSHNSEAGSICVHNPKRKELPILQEMTPVHSLMLASHRNPIELEPDVEQSTGRGLRCEGQ